jgi:hypothetical protein
MPYGICTLHLFGFECSFAETKGTYCNSEDQDTNSNENNDDYDIWETIYYDSNGKEIGHSLCEGTDYSNGTYDEWKTIYYTSSGHVCGTSITESLNYSWGTHGS